MLTRDHAADIFDKLRGLSSADEVELLISSGSSALTRFANNTIHQNVSEENTQISVRVSFGGRTARATTNKPDADSLRRVVESAEALARVQQEDPDLLPMPSRARKQNPAKPRLPCATLKTPHASPRRIALRRSRKWSTSLRRIG